MRRLLFLALLVSGCVSARVATITPLRQANDEQSTCEQIAREYKANTEIAGAKIAKNENSDTRDFWLGVFVWPGLMDLQNADGNEGNALLDRNIYLRELANSKSCAGSETWPEQPKRYTENPKRRPEA
ncbi:MAG: hypothetical protein OEN50_14695, partial [Deltaproteobacteria bacterium]|nr:hypothetical protein [Deltaproteobacteria bacterium]